MHKPQELLVKELDEAGQKVYIGREYIHYKNPNQTYRVLNIAITESDDSVCIIYEAQYGNNLVFVRPLKSWLDKVKWDNKLVDRFTLVS